MPTPSKDQSHLPFCQVMAGRGAPEVSHASTTDMPSITVLSRGPLVMLGAIPVNGDSGASKLHPGRSPHRQRARSLSCSYHSGWCGFPTGKDAGALRGPQVWEEAHTRPRGRKDWTQATPVPTLS